MALYHARGCLEISKLRHNPRAKDTYVLEKEKKRREYARKKKQKTLVEKSLEAQGRNILFIYYYMS